MADVPEVIGSELWCADKARLVLISGGKRREVIARLLSSHSSTLAYVRFRPIADMVRRANRVPKFQPMLGFALGLLFSLVPR